MNPKFMSIFVNLKIKSLFLSFFLISPVMASDDEDSCDEAVGDLDRQLLSIVTPEEKNMTGKTGKDIRSEKEEDEEEDVDVMVIDPGFDPINTLGPLAPPMASDLVDSVNPSGLVPVPKAKRQRNLNYSNEWAFLLDSKDPMLQKIGILYVEKQCSPLVAEYLIRCEEKPLVALEAFTLLQSDFNKWIYHDNFDEIPPLVAHNCLKILAEKSVSPKEVIEILSLRTRLDEKKTRLNDILMEISFESPKTEAEEKVIKSTNLLIYNIIKILKPSAPSS